MTGARLNLAALSLIIAVSSASAQTTPGFQGTLNNYAVNMNPANGSQHFNFHFRAHNNGVVEAPFEITNDSGNAFCARVRIVARDRPGGNILLDVRSATYCMQGKGPDTNFHERVQHVDWEFRTDPAVGRDGHDLYIVAENYQDKGVDLSSWTNLVRTAIEIIGFAAKIAPAIL